MFGKNQIEKRIIKDLKSNCFFILARVADALQNINRYMSYIQLSYSEWYSYRYDAGPENSFIIDGGFDMFDNGNYVCLCLRIVLYYCFRILSRQ